MLMQIVYERVRLAMAMRVVVVGWRNSHSSGAIPSHAISVRSIRSHAPSVCVNEYTYALCWCRWYGLPVVWMDDGVSHRDMYQKVKFEHEFESIDRWVTTMSEHCILYVVRVQFGYDGVLCACHVGIVQWRDRDDTADDVRAMVNRSMSGVGGHADSGCITTVMDHISYLES